MHIAPRLRSPLAALACLSLAACGMPDGSGKPFVGGWTTDELRAADDAEAAVRRRQAERGSDGEDLDAQVAQARTDATRRREHIELRGNGTATIVFQGVDGPAEDAIEGAWKEGAGAVTVTPTNRDGRAATPSASAPIVFRWDGSRLAIQTRDSSARSLRRYRDGEARPAATGPR